MNPTNPTPSESRQTPVWPRKSASVASLEADSTASLTAEQREAMWHVRNGADISDPFIAKHLRSVERQFPKLLWIGKPMGQYDGRKHVPYFGAILTAKGKEAIGLPGDFAPHYVD